MNTGDFEEQLRRQSIRPVPRQWRGEILDAARRAREPQPSSLNHQLASRWRELLWPCPQAWAALAAAWVVVLLLNLVSRGPDRVANASKPAPAPEFFIALREHQRLLTELIGTPPLIEPLKPFKPRPRCDIPRSTVSVEFV